MAKGRLPKSILHPARLTTRLRITGTTTITSFGTTYNGPRFVRFAAALTLTHNATTLILPGGVNIKTAAGDACIVVPIGAGAGWQVVAFTGTSSIGTSGYQKLSSGLVIQWGNAVTSTSAAQSVTLPVAFNTVIVNVQITPAISSQAVFGTTDFQSVSSFTFSIWNTSGARVAVAGYWVAIGY